MQQPDLIGCQIVLERLDQSPADAPPAQLPFDGHQVNLGRGREMPVGKEHADWPAIRAPSFAAGPPEVGRQ
jgi:hypothetical protein